MFRRPAGGDLRLVEGALRNTGLGSDPAHCAGSQRKSDGREVPARGRDHQARER